MVSLCSPYARISFVWLSCPPQNVAYRELQPHPALAHDVMCYWAMAADSPLLSPMLRRGFSKGYVDLILPAEGHFCQGAEHHLFGESRPGAYLVGPLSRPAPITSTGRCTTVGVRFRPGRAQALFGLSALELTDQVIAVDDLDRTRGRDITERVGEESSPCAKLQQLEARLLALKGRSHAQDPDLQQAIRVVEETRGRVSVEELARSVGKGRRQLERLFRNAVGLTPKMQCRITRVEHALSLIAKPGPLDWHDVVHRSGFYDQAHFIRDFRAITGATPSAYRAQTQLCSR